MAARRRRPRDIRIQCRAGRRPGSRVPARGSLSPDRRPRDSSPHLSAMAAFTIEHHQALEPPFADEVKGPSDAKPQPLIVRSEEHTSELQSQSNLVCRLLLEKK